MALRLTEDDLKRMLAKRAPRLVQPLPPSSPTEDFKRGDTNKFNAHITVVDGIQFDSKKEAKRYQTLDALQDLGRISKLRHHVMFDLIVNGELLCRYEADFTYRDEKGKLTVEDVKGMKKGPAYDLFRLKAGLMRALHGAHVKEV